MRVEGTGFSAGPEKPGLRFVPRERFLVPETLDRPDPCEESLSELSFLCRACAGVTSARRTFTAAFSPGQDRLGP